jgi:hypothetical protein
MHANYRLQKSFLAQPENQPQQPLRVACGAFVHVSMSTAGFLRDGLSVWSITTCTKDYVFHLDRAVMSITQDERVHLELKGYLLQRVALPL